MASSSTCFRLQTMSNSDLNSSNEGEEDRQFDDIKIYFPPSEFKSFPLLMLQRFQNQKKTYDHCVANGMGSRATLLSVHCDSIDSFSYLCTDVAMDPPFFMKAALDALEAANKPKTASVKSKKRPNPAAPAGIPPQIFAPRPPPPFLLACFLQGSTRVFTMWA